MGLVVTSREVPRNLTDDVSARVFDGDAEEIVPARLARIRQRRFNAVARHTIPAACERSPRTIIGRLLLERLVRHLVRGCLCRWRPRAAAEAGPPSHQSASTPSENRTTCSNACLTDTAIRSLLAMISTSG